MAKPLAQGSLAWAEHREAHANASEAAALMGAARFQPRNPTELCMVRNGTLVIAKTFPMQMGSDREAGALGRLKQEMHVNGRRMENLAPEVLTATVEGIPMSASLDGRDGDTWVEIKHVMSENSPYWTEAGKDRIEESALWQMTQQYIVGREHGVTNGYLYVVCGGQGRMVPYSHSQDREDQLLDNWKLVWPYIEAGTVYGARNDKDWRDAAATYMALKKEAELAEARLTKVKEALIFLANGKDAHGCGVSVQEVTRQGGPDYSKLPAGVVESLPRKKDTTYTTVTMTKTEK